jgi:hypothetical protein
MRLAIVCLLLCYGQSVAHADTFYRSVAPGESARMRDYKSWDSNCVSRSGMVKVNSKPQNGKLTTRIVNSVMGRSRISGLATCQGVPAKALQVNYTAARGFRGTDTFTLDVTYGDGSSLVDTFIVTVH